jgi:hypothetical protein
LIVRGEKTAIDWRASSLRADSKRRCQKSLATQDAMPGVDVVSHSTISPRSWLVGGLRDAQLSTTSSSAPMSAQVGRPMRAASSSAATACDRGKA